MRQITSKEIKSVIKNYTTNKSIGLEDFTTELYQTCKVLIPRILKLFQETEREEMLPNSFHKDRIILIPKPDKDATRKNFCTFENTIKKTSHRVGKHLQITYLVHDMYIHTYMI